MTTRRRLSPAIPSSGDASGDARTITLREEDAVSIATIVRALPDPDTLPAGTLLFLPAPVSVPRSLAQSVLSALGRTKTVSRALRCTALVARGYTNVGAAVDPATRIDLAWGVAPATGPSRD